MPSNNHRLIKAAKRTIRAEFTLIVVIILVSSWSVYALYKLVISVDTDTSFLSQFAIKSQNDKQNDNDNTNKRTANSSIKSKSAHHNSNYGDYASDATVSQIEPQTNSLSSANQIAAQLAMYKSQIMQELIARKQEQQQVNNKLALNEPRKYSRGLLPIKSSQYDAEDWRRRAAQLRASSPYEEHSARTGGSNRLQRTGSINDAAPPPFADDPADFDWLLKKQQPGQLFNWQHRDRSSDYSRQPGRAAETSLSSDESLNDDSQVNELQHLSTPQPVDVVTMTTAEPASQESSSADASSANENMTDTDGGVATSTIEPDDAAGADNGGEMASGGGDDEESKTDKIDDDAMKRVKNTVHSIDEEVDRMTQPSLGTVSQSRQDTPFDLVQTVQFDDTPLSASDQLVGGGGTPKSSPASLTASQKLSRGPKDEPPAADVKQQADLQVENNRPVRTNEKFRANRNVLRFIRKSLGDDRGSDNSTPASRRRSTNSHGPVLRPDSYASQHEPKSVPPNRRSKRSAPIVRKRLDDGRHKQLRQRRNVGASLPQIPVDDQKIKELLEHKRLLDILRNERAKSTSGNLKTASTLKPSDHKAADTGYTVDEGLLLYPAVGAYNPNHKYSLATKSKKKSKKKMMVGMKKGGEKAKKHKHDLKKFHKEKHFKGAKKGKKMKKGKGGKGGKKGKKFYKDKGFKKKGFKDIYVKSEFGQKKSYFDEFRDKDFKKKWKNFDEKYKHESMKKWQAKDVKGAKKVKDHGEKYKKFKKGKWKKKFHSDKQSESSKKKSDEFK